MTIAYDLAEAIEQIVEEDGNVVLVFKDNSVLGIIRKGDEVAIKTGKAINLDRPEEVLARELKELLTHIAKSAGAKTNKH